MISTVIFQCFLLLLGLELILAQTLSCQLDPSCGILDGTTAIKCTLSSGNVVKRYIQIWGPPNRVGIVTFGEIAKPSKFKLEISGSIFTLDILNTGKEDAGEYEFTHGTPKDFVQLAESQLEVMKCSASASEITIEKTKPNTGVIGKIFNDDGTEFESHTFTGMTQNTDGITWRGEWTYSKTLIQGEQYTYKVTNGGNCNQECTGSLSVNSFWRPEPMVAVLAICLGLTVFLKE